jgi:RNA polymerase sigma-70 factor (ECF subfamily)
MVKISNEELSELILSIANGDKSAIGKLYMEMKGAMTAVAQSRLPRDDVEDAVSDSLEKIVLKAKKFREKINPKAWIYKIVSNTCLDRLRVIKKARTTPLDPIRNYVYDSEDFGIIVNDAFTVLNEREIKIVTLSYWYNLSFDEIAQVYRISKSLAKYYYDKAILKMKNRVKD